MKIGILVAMEEEIKRLREAVHNVQVYTIAKQTFYDGQLEGLPVTIVQAGIGKVNAALATTLLIEAFHVEVVINTGSAGAIQTGLEIGDLVVSSQLAYHDADNRGFGYTYGQIPQMPLYYQADEAVLLNISKAAEATDWVVHEGLIVTGDSFVSSQEQIAHIQTHFPKALVTEMEGSAVGQICTQYGIPFAVIRAVSDTADEEATVDFDTFVVEAGKRSAELVLQLLKEYKNEENSIG